MVYFHRSNYKRRLYEKKTAKTATKQNNLQHRTRLWFVSSLWEDIVGFDCRELEVREGVEGGVWSREGAGMTRRQFPV